MDGRGYCFPYDDVTPNGGVDQSGFVNSGNPLNFLVTVGGGNAYAKRGNMKRVVQPKIMTKRSMSWDEDIKMPILEEDVERDLEKGDHLKLLNELASPSGGYKLPASTKQYLEPYVAVSHSYNLKMETYY